MKKVEAIAALAEKLDVTKVQAETTLTTVLDLISEAVVTEGDFVVTGWGKFEKVDKEARKGRNPKTGETLDIPAKSVIKFRVGSKLKTAINDGVALKLTK